MKFFALTLAAASAHICLLSPIQRGGVQGSVTAGADVCGNVAVAGGPCGNTVAGPPVAFFFEGMTHHVAMLKNLDHCECCILGKKHCLRLRDLGCWLTPPPSPPAVNKANPGNFSVSLLDNKGMSTPIAVIPDTDAPSQTIYNAQFTLPVSLPSGMYVIKAAYNTDSIAHPQFVQCSDIEIRSHSPPAGAAKPVQR